MSTLDPDVYGDYAQVAEISLAGAYIYWKHVPEAELERIVPLIREQESRLDDTYRTKLEEDGDSITLHIQFRRPATPAAVRSLKGEVMVLLVLTSWGGP